MENKQWHFGFWDFLAFTIIIDSITSIVIAISNRKEK